MMPNPLSILLSLVVHVDQSPLSINRYIFLLCASVNQSTAGLPVCRSHILIWDQIDHTHCRNGWKEVVKGEIFALDAKFRGGNQRRSPFLSFKHRSSFKNLLRVYPNIIIILRSWLCLCSLMRRINNSNSSKKMSVCLSVKTPLLPTQSWLWLW